jgi:hypothetical protein
MVFSEEEDEANTDGSQFDLLSATRAAIKASSILWKFRHVKGHQDDILEANLDRWALLNIAMLDSPLQRCTGSKNPGKDNHSIRQSQVNIGQFSSTAGRSIPTYYGTLSCTKGNLLEQDGRAHGRKGPHGTRP